MSVLKELRRRGVIQVGMAYVVLSWLTIQVADVILPTFEAPDWAMKVLTQLSKISGFKTLSRTSTQRYAQTELAIPQIADELGATVVLEGGVQRSNDRVRINAQLIDGESDEHLWAETYDRELNTQNIFAIQSEIARAIAGSLKTTLSPEENRQLDEVPTDDLEAYDEYTQGLAAFNNFDVEDYEKASRHLLTATELDPGFASAWAGLCRVELSRYQTSSDRSHFDIAEAACSKALELDGSRVEVYIALGALFSFYYVYSDRPDRFDLAAKYDVHLTSLRPDLPSSWNNLGTAHYMLNQYAEAADAWHESIDLLPTRTAYTNTGLALYYSGQFEEAAAMQEKATELAPNDHRAWGRLGEAQRHTAEQQDKARETFNHAAELALELLKVNDRDWQTKGLLAVYLVYAGQFADAEKFITEALEESERRSEVLFYAALVQLQLSNEASSLDLLEEAINQDNEYRHLIATDLDFGILADNARFKALLSPHSAGR